MCIRDRIIGIGTLMGGIISVSNIMLVTINERKREIGVKRAIGAKPGDIRLQIALESLTITFLSGLGGMILALIIMIGVNAAVSGSANADFFYRPLIPFELAILLSLIHIEMCIRDRGMMAFDAARMRGIPCEMLIYPDETHCAVSYTHLTRTGSIFQ